MAKRKNKSGDAAFKFIMEIIIRFFIAAVQITWALFIDCIRMFMQLVKRRPVK